jgi:hypothetical protein
MTEPNEQPSPPSAAAPSPATDAAEPDAALLHSMRAGFWSGERVSYWLTRFSVLRGLGLIYTVAFAVLWNQMLPLFGERGILPARALLREMRDASFWELPTLFVLDGSDRTLQAAAAFGLALSLALLFGADNALILAALWVLYLSFVHVGQDFYGYGWEILLLEAGFLAIFLAPLTSLRPLAAKSPPRPVIWLLRWLVFRLMFGAGMIKLRGDPCWRDLSCLAYHYETQPNPHPLSWLLHQAPLWFHQAGVLWNHVVELVAPWFVFGPRRARHVAGLAIVAFQIGLILSGNLSFLNWLTIAIALACFDDSALARVLPKRLVERANRLEGTAPPSSRVQHGFAIALSALVIVLSYGPVTNMLSRRQRMNSSFDPLHLVNTYGAFGSVGKTRDEVILEGTSARELGANTRWQAYEFKCKPGDVERRPCLITPYHLRLDWQMWFAALSDFEQEPWILSLVFRLLQNDRDVVALLERSPFPARPPRYIRAQRYRYHFTKLGEAGHAYWRRELLGMYLPPLSADDPALLDWLVGRGIIER